METIEPKKVEYMIEANPRYNIISPGTLLLENTAETVLHMTIPSTGSSTSMIQFTVNANKMNFDRGVSLQIPVIPLIFNRSVAAAVLPTSDNYISGFFNNYDQLCMSEFSFLNCIQSIQTNIDGYNYPAVDIGEKLRVLANYYDPQDVHRFFPNSMPDQFNNFDLYKTDAVVDLINTNGVLSTLSTNSTAMLIKRPNLATNNPFETNLSDNYSTRVPNLQFDTSGTTTVSSIQCNLVDSSTFLPMTLFGIPGDDISIYNVNQITITINLRSNWQYYLFNRRSGAGRMDTILLPSNTSTFKPSLHYTAYRMPQYLESKKDENAMYQLNFPVIETQGNVTKISMTSLQSKATINLTDYNLKCVPKSILVYVIPEIVNDVDALDTPNHFARIDSLSVRVNNTLTQVFSSPLTGYEIAKKNGLSLSKECLYNKGCPIMLNVSNDLSCPTNTLIGSSDGIKLLQVEATITNLKTRPCNYLFKVICIYDSILRYNPAMRKFEIIDAIKPPSNFSSANDSDTLYNATIQNANLIGGSWLSTLGNYAKSFLNGAKNVVAAAVTNKSNFRDNLVKAYNGGQVIHSSTNTFGGGFDNHIPLNGGMSVGNWRPGK